MPSRNAKKRAKKRAQKLKNKLPIRPKSAEDNQTLTGDSRETHEKTTQKSQFPTLNDRFRTLDLNDQIPDGYCRCNVECTCEDGLEGDSENDRPEMEPPKAPLLSKDGKMSFDFEDDPPKAPLLSKDGKMSFDFEDDPPKPKKQNMHRLVRFAINYLEEQGEENIKLWRKGDISHALMSLRFSMIHKATALANNIEKLLEIEKAAKEKKEESYEEAIITYLEQNVKIIFVKQTDGELYLWTWRYFLPRYLGGELIDPHAYNSDEDDDNDEEEEEPEEPEPSKKVKPKLSRMQRELAALLTWHVK